MEMTAVVVPSLDIRVARIFNTNGPRTQQDDGKVICNFVCQTLKDFSITIYGDGSRTRSFFFVNDLNDGLIRLIESDHSGSPINLALRVLNWKPVVSRHEGLVKTVQYFRDLV